MNDIFASPGQSDDDDATTFAKGRLPGRTYASRNFTLERSGSTDDGTPARFITKVFDEANETELVREGEEWVVSETPAGRAQVKLLVAREAGNVKEIWIQRVPMGQGKVKQVLNLRGDDAERLVALMQLLPSIGVEGATTVRVDDDLLRDLMDSPGALDRLYRESPDHFRELVTNDEYASDVVALAARRRAVAEFDRLLHDDDYFDDEVERTRGGPERVWQHFFEDNPWMFGVTLAGQLLLEWDPKRLEQVVKGGSIAGVGKRLDALMQTSGRVRSMVFAEIKTHRADLLHKEYRAGCWAPSTDLAGGVAQIQGTVHRAVDAIGERITQVAEDGSEVVGGETYLLRPRSFLVIGNLSELEGAGGGLHLDKFRSFELYRRQLQEPEILTFDELFARASWVVEQAAAGH